MEAARPPLVAEKGKFPLAQLLMVAVALIVVAGLV